MAMPLRVPTYTVDDLEAFPCDGNRYELLDGVLLVTPSASVAHQAVATRIRLALGGYLAPHGHATLLAPGAVEIRPKTHLEPDILVVPANFPLRAKWNDIRGWWLAVEVLSRSSRVYDRDFKRDAYLALGVGEVWLVDLDQPAVFVSRPGGPIDEASTSKLKWAPPGMPIPFELDLSTIFKGL